MPFPPTTRPSVRAKISTRRAPLPSTWAQARYPGQICPSIAGVTIFWPASYSRKTGFLYIPAYEGCSNIQVDTSAHVKGSFGGGGGCGGTSVTSSITMIDPATGDVKKRVEFPYPNS